MASATTVTVAGHSSAEAAAMSQHMLQQWLSASRIDRSLAKLGVVACILLLGLRLVTTQVLLIIIPVATGVACVVYLVVQHHRPTEFPLPTLPAVAIGYLPATVFAGLAALVIALSVTGSRTPGIYLLTGLVGSLILAQPLLTDDADLAPGLVLAQIIVAAVVIRLSVLFMTPGFVGVDIWTHVPVFVTGIVEAESLSAIADSKYSMAPLYHSLGAIAALVFGSARVGMYFSVGLLVPLSALFIYGTANLLVPARWALVATALYAFGDEFIRWGIHQIPTSLGLVFFLGALYCVTRLCFTDDLWAVGLLAVFSLAIVFTHQVSTAIILVFLAVTTVVVIAVRLFPPLDSTVSPRTLGAFAGTFVLTLGVTIAAWLSTPWYAEDPFLVQILDTLEATLLGEAGFLNLASGAGGGGGGGGSGGEAAQHGLMAELIPFIDWAGFAILLSVAVIGGLTLLRMNQPAELIGIFLISASTMFVIIFGFSLFGVRTILPGRWMAFMYALFAIIAAVGLFHLSTSASRRVILVVFVILAVGYPMTMVVAEKATLDSPAFDEQHPRFSYTDTEIAAVDTISRIYAPDFDASVDSDHPYTTLYQRLGGYGGLVAVFDEDGSTAERPFIARDYQTEGPAGFREAGEPTRSIDSRTIAPDVACADTRNLVYANDNVRLCMHSSVSAGGAT